MCLWKRVSFNIIASSWIMGTSRILIPKQYLESRRHKSPSKMAQFQGFGAKSSSDLGTSQDHMKSVGDVIYADLFTEVLAVGRDRSSRWVNTVNTERTTYLLSTNQVHEKKIDEGEHVDRIDTLQSMVLGCQGGRSKGCALVSFKSPEEARRAAGSPWMGTVGKIWWKPKTI